MMVSSKARWNIQAAARRKSLKPSNASTIVYYLRPKPILRIIKTMLEDKDVCVRRLREGYEFFQEHGAAPQ